MWGFWFVCLTETIFSFPRPSSHIRASYWYILHRVIAVFSFLFCRTRYSILRTAVETDLWKRDQQSPSVSTNSFGIKAASIQKFYHSTVYNCISSHLLSTTKTSHSSYDTAYFKVTELALMLSFLAVSVIRQLRSRPKSLSSSAILTYRFLLHTVRPHRTSPLETLNFSPVLPNLLRPPGPFPFYPNHLGRISAFGIIIFNMKVPFSFCLH